MPSKLGIGIGWQRGDAWREKSLALLQPQAYFNWLAQPELMDDFRYMPMCFSLHDATPYIEVGQAYPHKLFLLGNEPELAQTSTTPLEAKAFAERWVGEVGGEWAGFGVIITDGGLAWLGEYLSIGGIVGTHWHVHNYWATEVVGWVFNWMRWVRWMRQHDVVRPTIVPETNLFGVSGDEAMRLLDKVMDGTLPDADLLHSYIHYSDCDWHGIWHWSDLRREDGSLTPLGVHFVELVTRPVGSGEAEPEPEPQHSTFLPWLKGEA